MQNPRVATSIPIGVVVATTSKVYYQSIPLTFVANNIPLVSAQIVYHFGIKFVLNLTDITAITGNNLTTLDYQRHSSFRITFPTDIGGYGCDFSQMFIAAPTSQLKGAWCKFTSTSVTIGGYQSITNLSSVEFTILASNPLSQTYAIQLLERYKGVDTMVAIGSTSGVPAPSSPALAGTSTTSNVSYMATISRNFTFATADYLLLELPAATVCCTEVTIDGTNLSSFTFANASRGIIVKLPALNGSSHNLSITGIGLTSGFVSGGSISVTEFVGLVATNQRQCTIQATTFTEASWRLIASDTSAGFPYANYTFTFNTTSSPFAETDLVLTFNASSYLFSNLPDLEQLLVNGSYRNQLPSLTKTAAGTLRLTNFALGRLVGTISLTLFGIANPLTVGNNTINIAYVDQTGFQYASAAVNYTITSASPTNSNPLIVTVVPNSTVSSKLLIVTLPFWFVPRKTTMQLQFVNVTIGTNTRL